jgi:hypothetical protein
MAKQHYETKPMIPVEVKPEEPKDIKNICPLAACSSNNVVRQDYQSVTLIRCLKCGYTAKYVEGKLV